MNYRIKKVLEWLYLTTLNKHVTLALCFELDSMLGRLEHDTELYCLTLKVYDYYAFKLASWVLEFEGLWDPRDYK